MSAQSSCNLVPVTRLRHELRFTSLYHPGRGLVFPCDETGHVDIDSLSERLRNAYFGARAMIGREYLYPALQRML
jgi:hypothetical protein